MISEYDVLRETHKPRDALDINILPLNMPWKLDFLTLLTPWINSMSSLSLVDKYANKLVWWHERI